MSALPVNFERGDENANLNCHHQATVELVAYNEIAKTSEAAPGPAVASKSSATIQRETSNVEDIAVQEDKLTLLDGSVSTEEENTRPSLVSAADEHSAVDCDIPGEYLIPCHQIKEEPGDPFSEPAEEAQTNSNLGHLTVAEATTIKSESADHEVPYWNAMPETDVGPHLRTPIKSCSVVLHALDVTLLKTLPNPYDAITMTNKLKTQIQNCNQCKRASETFHDSMLHEENGDCQRVKEHHERTINHACSLPHTRKLPGCNLTDCTVTRESETLSKSARCDAKDHVTEALLESVHCEANFKRPEYLSRDEKQDPGEGSYQCSFCGKKFKKDRYRKVHERVHSLDKQYQCAYCDKYFSDSYNQKCHERIHTGEKPYQCSYCDKKFHTITHQNLHERTHTGEKPFQCCYCSRKFSSSSSRISHERTHTGEKPYRCSYCDKNFFTIANKKLHERTHTGEKPFQCSYCGKAFSSNSNKNFHERSHRGEKPHQCSYCDKNLTTSASKKVHERTHTGEKPYRCSYCDQNFSTSGGLTLHERTHTGEKPYQCSYCNKKFSRISHQKVHERMHTGEKPYECSYCHKRFSQSASKKSHERKHSCE